MCQFKTITGQWTNRIPKGFCYCKLHCGYVTRNQYKLHKCGAKNWQGVKDWKAKALYWDIQDREKSNNGFNGIMTHSYDYEELEKEFVCK